MVLHHMPGLKCITVVKGSGADHVFLTLDAIEATWPHTDDLCVRFDAARGSGAGFCQQLFPGAPINIVEDPNATP